MRHSPDRCPLHKHIRSQAPFLRRRYPALQVLRACLPPHTARPVPHGSPVGASPPPLGLPVLRRISLYMHAVANTPACLRPSDRQAGPLGARVALFPNDGGLPRSTVGSAPASPFSRPAQHSLRVTACILAESPCLPAAGRRPSTPEASEISLPTSLLRLLPTCLPSMRRRQAVATLVGWDSHPLKFRAFHGALRNRG